MLDLIVVEVLSTPITVPERMATWWLYQFNCNQLDRLVKVLVESSVKTTILVKLGLVLINYNNQFTLKKY